MTEARGKPEIGTVFKTSGGVVWTVVLDESGTPEDPDIFVIQAWGVDENGNDIPARTGYSVIDFWDMVDSGHWIIRKPGIEMVDT